MGFSFGRRTPTVIQMEALECGAASLSMILGYYGRFVSLEQLRVDCAVSRDGSKANNILKAARNYGLTAKAFKRELEDLKQLQSPAILFWEFNHFVVLDRVVGKKYYLNDPGVGRRILREEEFSRSFTGIALEFEKGPDFKKGGERPSFYANIIEPFRYHYSFIFFCFWVALLLAVGAFVLPALVRSITDDIVINNFYSFSVPILAFTLCLLLFRAFLSYILKINLEQFSKSYSLQSSAGTLWHILRLPMQFFSQRFVGDVASRVQGGIRIGPIASQLFFSLVSALITGTLLFILLGQYSLILTLVTFLAFASCVVIFTILMAKQKDLDLHLRIERDRTFSNLISGLTSIEALKASGREGEFFTRFSGLWAKANNVKNNLSLPEAMLATIPSAITWLALMSLWIFGALEYFSSAMTIGMIVAARFLGKQLFDSIDVFTSGHDDMDLLAHETRRLKDIQNYPLAAQWKHIQSAHPTSTNTIQGNLSLQGVSFGYDRYAPLVIENISIDIKAGSRVAFVGSTGSGKSTIGKLIAGFYQPQSGKVLFDGKDASQIPHETLTHALAYVEQDIYLMAGTITENLTLFDSSIPETDVIQAAKDAMIHDDIISVFGGYESHIAEGGGNLSGGQIQRLEIARALVRNSQIIILDEATSALDPPTEKKIDENLRRRGCTLVMIAHRLSTIRDCDEIIVLDGGKIVQRGIHDELINQQGLYQNLIQTSG